MFRSKQHEPKEKATRAGRPWGRCSPRSGETHGVRDPTKNTMSSPKSNESTHRSAEWIVCHSAPTSFNSLVTFFSWSSIRQSFPFFLSFFLSLFVSQLVCWSIPSPSHPHPCRGRPRPRPAPAWPRPPRRCCGRRQRPRRPRSAPSWRRSAVSGAVGAVLFGFFGGFWENKTPNSRKDSCMLEFYVLRFCFLKKIRWFCVRVFFLACLFEQLFSLIYPFCLFPDGRCVC